MRERAFCVYCGRVITPNKRACGDRACGSHSDLPGVDALFSTQSTGLSTPQAARRREAIAPQIGADPA